MDVDNPHISFPFRLNDSGTGSVVVEQDSDDEIMDCVQVLLSTELGSREEIPSYGIPDQAFKQGGIDEDQVLLAINRWERRAEVFLDTQSIASLVQHAQVNLIQRGND